VSSLKVNSIHKSFKHRHVVKGVSFEVSSSSVVGLLGPNGAGKTTSFYMVVGLVTPDEGSIELDDENITSLPIYERARRGISYLPQEPSVFRKLTVRENIQVALDAQNITGSQKQETLEKLINEFSLNHITESYGYALSGGERRRVEIARSLVGRPKFLLLDEPFAGIDPIAVYDIQQIIRKLRDQGIGILITDHNVRETLGICDFSYIMKDGAVQVKGSPDAITKSDLAKKFYLGENFRL
jgi:lipopolysaccharide export system ATP-binding protein